MIDLGKHGGVQVVNRTRESVICGNRYDRVEFAPTDGARTRAIEAKARAAMDAARTAEPLRSPSRMS